MIKDDKGIIEHLILGQELSASMLHVLMDKIFRSDMPAVQVAAILALIQAKGATGSEIAHTAQIVLARASLFDRPSYKICDIVGTGGDGHNTINISTAASLVAASCGLAVAKHGNFSVSSKCGSADVLLHLGIPIELDQKKVRNCLDKAQWCFLLAQSYHPSFKEVRLIRQELKIKTIFNIIGPLVNPSRPNFMLVGVYDQSLLVPVAKALGLLGVERALVVHGAGLDEIALHGSTSCTLLDHEQISSFVINPPDLGLKSISLSDIGGALPKDNAQALLNILAAEAPYAHMAMVAASAGALLWVAMKAENLKEGVELAMNAILEKRAQKTFKLVKELSNGT